MYSLAFPGERADPPIDSVEMYSGVLLYAAADIMKT